MTALQVRLFGKFSILQNETDIVRALGGSRKKLALLEYLVLQWDRAVPSAELFEVIWPTEDNTNPGNALKTLVSRLRKDLSAFGAQRLIVTKSNAYMWNTQAPCEIDMHVFETLCAELLACEELTDAARGGFRRALDIYVGDLLENADNQSWVVSHSVRCHELYLHTVYKYITLLNARGEYQEVCDVCRRALEIDALDSVLSLELINALTALGKTREATAQYSYASGLHEIELGDAAKERDLRALYRRILEDRQQTETGIADILRELTAAAPADGQGALICDYSILQDIYQINMRSLQRLNIPMFVALMTLNCADDRPAESMMLDKLMGVLQEIMRTNMRRGDTLSRYNLNQFVLLLPSVNYDTGRYVLERIKKQFYQQHPNSRFVLNYCLVPAEQPRSAQ
ncbi:MAG: BTAD domain-containing putative transcriptional regulator [Oscillospiraceae bacterium]|nr:BTAD domain-containing putative transcriptional regulator [Oscillospiraceae bacterium]